MFLKFIQIIVPMVIGILIGYYFIDDKKIIKTDNILVTKNDDSVLFKTKNIKSVHIDMDCEYVLSFSDSKVYLYCSE